MDVRSDSAPAAPPGIDTAKMAGLIAVGCILFLGGVRRAFRPLLGGTP